MSKKNEQSELVNVAMSSDAVVTLQIVQPWTNDCKGKRKTAPELCLLIESEERKICVDVYFKQNELNAFIGQLITMGQRLAIACEPFREQQESN